MKKALDAAGAKQERPAIAREAAFRGGLASVLRVPDEGEGVVVFSSCGAAQIGVEAAGSELGLSEA